MSSHPARTSAPGSIERRDQGPIVLVGPPLALRGAVRLQNVGDRRVAVRDSRLLGSLAADRTGGREVVCRVAHPARMRPGEEELVPLTAAVDPTTAPGRYTLELEIAGRSYPAQVHVTELVDLHVSPTRIVLENVPSARIAKTVVLSNVGNVAVAVGTISPVAMRPEADQPNAAQERLVRLLRQIVNPGDEPTVVSAGHPDVRGHLEVTMLGGTVTLLPGDVQEIELEVALPAGLGPNGRFVGVAGLSTADLEFLVVPAQGAVPPQPKPTPRPRKRKAV